MSKTVIVTGGAQGIGKCVARTLLKQGMAVVVADIDDEAGQECVEEYGELGQISFVRTDVGSEESVRECVAHTEAGFSSLDGLVNNAGMGGPFGTPPDELSVDEWDRVIRTNLTGCFLMAKYAIPGLRKAKGAIVSIASTRALQSEAFTEPYSASKGGIVALTHSLAVSLSGDVRVNCVSPGWIDVSQWKKRRKAKQAELTEADHKQHPAGRVGGPEDVAAAVAFLLSEQAGFVTGQNYVVDGGMTKKMIYVE